nr:Zgc:113194 [Danio rerio]AAI64288.1 Zgc:113194 protein [Danio rerio]
MAGRVSASLLNSLTRGTILFKNKKCLRRSVVFISRCHARSLSRSSISAAQLDLSSHLSGRNYADLYELSVKDPENFWGSIAKERLAWTKPFDQVSDCDISSGKINWFLGGQLNVSVNCLDVHVANDPSRVALIWEKDEPGTEERITYRYIH